MTALTMPARPEEDASLRPVPWRRMAWVTWRQHRFALAGVAALLGALAVCLWLVGLQLHHAYAAAAACHPAGSAACDGMVISFSGMDGFLANGFILQAVPALIGAFVGAPVLAREMETGTFRYAWTQGFGRWRWTLAKLVLLAIAVAAAAGAVQPAVVLVLPAVLRRGQPDPRPPRLPLFPGLFDLRGVAFAAWTLAAFAIGALAGMLIRRVVPAIAATLAVYAGLAFAAGLYLRQHYLTPLAHQQPERARLRVDHQPAVADQGRPRRSASPCSARSSSGAPHARRERRDPEVHQRDAVPHPARVHAVDQLPAGSRFWPFQWIEGGWLLALSVLLIAVTVWLVRRRAA